MAPQHSSCSRGGGPVWETGPRGSLSPCGPRVLTESGRWLPRPPGSSGPGNTSGTAGDRRQQSGQQAARPIRPPPGRVGLAGSTWTRQPRAPCGHTRHQSPALWSPPRPQAGATQRHPRGHTRSAQPPSSRPLPPPRCLPLAIPLLSLFRTEAAGLGLPCCQYFTASPAWRVCAGSQSHPHPRAASPSGRAQHPPCPMALSPLKPSLLSSRPGLQAWPLRTPSQASDHRPGAPCPAPPVLTSHHPGEGRDSGRPGSGVHRWAPRLGDHVCHVLLFPPFLSEQQGVPRPTPCRPGTGHAGLAAPRRPGGLLGKTGEPCRAATLSRGSSPRSLRMTIKTRLLSPGTPAVADIPSGGRSSPTAWMNQLRQQASGLLGTPPRPSTHELWGLASVDAFFVVSCLVV